MQKKWRRLLGAAKWMEKNHKVSESALSPPMLYINELLRKPDILVSFCRCPSIYSAFKAALHSFKNQNLNLPVLAHWLYIASVKQVTQTPVNKTPFGTPQNTCSATSQQGENKGPVQPHSPYVFLMISQLIQTSISFQNPFTYHQSIACQVMHATVKKILRWQSMELTLHRDCFSQGSSLENGQGL